MTSFDDMSTRKQFRDVRMRGFPSRTTVDDAWSWLDAQIERLPSETVAFNEAGGRVLAETIISQCDVPSFDRSMMDGLAVRAADTESASSYNRLPLKVIGEVMPGQTLATTIEPGQAARIMTGAPLPPGADAVLPAEKIEWATDQAWALDEVSPGKNVGCRGEDIEAGTAVLPGGRILRPQDLGVLSSIGISPVPVVRRPRVRLIITGNELLPAGSRPRGYQISDANGPMLTALVQRDGGIPIHPGIVPDEPDSILNAIQEQADILIISGGSSVGQEDFAPALIAERGELAVHGIAMRPSSPTGLGRLAEKLVFLLPGNPVSCLCGYDFFAGRAIRQLGGRSADWPYRAVSLPLARKLVSAVGRVDYARVRIVNGNVEPLAIAGASVLSSTTRADGFVVVPHDCEGYPAGANVTVHLYD